MTARPLVAAVIGAVLLVYEPLQAVLPWRSGPRWLLYGRMVPFFILVFLLGGLLSPVRRIVWSIAIAMARVVFHDVATRLGVFPSTPWLPIVALPPIVQVLVIDIALRTHTMVYCVLMFAGATTCSLLGAWLSQGSMQADGSAGLRTHT